MYLIINKIHGTCAMFFTMFLCFAEIYARQTASCFYFYGNYGGPDWTGGQWKPWENFGNPYDPGIPPGLALPIDAQDACYMDHDRCYSKARNPQNGKCSSPGQQTADTMNCDSQLAQCLGGVPYSPSSLGAFTLFQLMSMYKLNMLMTW